MQCAVGLTESRCGHEITIEIASAELSKPQVHALIYNVCAMEIVYTLQLTPLQNARFQAEKGVFIYKTYSTKQTKSFRK